MCLRRRKGSPAKPRLHPANRYATRDTRHSPRRFFAFSLVEVMIATMITGLLFVAALSTVATARSHQAKMSNTQRGQLLAEALMAEILPLDYWDSATQSGMGPESGEVSTGNRSLYDDVDDYKGWEAGAPQNRDGSILTGFEGFAWQRSVVVEWLNPLDLTQTSVVETLIKRIAVEVKHNNVIVGRISAIRTKAP